MAVKNLYPNLPGHLVEFKDGGLQLVSDTNEKGYNKSLLILGTAFDGPINEPVKIDSTTVSQLFGSDVGDNGYPNGATLTKYAKQAFRNGFSDVRCMRVTGSQAYVEIEKATAPVSETKTGTPVIAVAEGNKNPVDFALSRIPMVELSLRIKVTDGPYITPDSYGLYDGMARFNANTLNKNAELTASYQYTAIKDKSGFVNETDAGTLPAYATANPITNAKNEGDSSFTDTALSGIALVDDGMGGITPIVLDFDPAATAPEYIYKTPRNSYNGNYEDISGKLPLTDGLVVKNGANVLVEGVDYTVNGNKIEFTADSIAAGNVADGNLIAVEYYVAVTNNAVDSHAIPADADQVVELENVPMSGSVKVYADNVPVTTFTVDYPNKKVNLTAGEFTINSAIKVTYQYEEFAAPEKMTVWAKYGGSLYKKAKVKIEEVTRTLASGAIEIGRKFTFTKPDSKVYGTHDVPFYFTSFDCPTVGTLKKALADYSLNNVFEITSDDDDILTKDFPVFESELVSGGDDGVVVTNNEMYEALSGTRYTEADLAAGKCKSEEVGYLKNLGAYQILENYHCDYIYVAGVYADSKQTVNPNSDFHQELALLCAVLTYRTKMTHGFIDVKPNANTTLVGIQDYVNRLVSMNNVHYMRDSDGVDIVDSNGNKMDIGWYTSIVVGPEPVMSSDTLGTYYGSPAIAYAALCASIKPQSAPTNKALPGVRGMKYKFSNKQMDSLVGNRMVVFRLKNEGTSAATSTPYVVDGITAGAPNSDYARISTVKIVTDVVDQIREVADPFIGEPNTIEQRNALAALISKR